MGRYTTTTESRTRLDTESGDCLDSDRERLQKLGYDPVLGRPLNFWSNMFLTLTNMSPVYDIVASITVWGHNGPLLFVSRAVQLWRQTLTVSRSSGTRASPYFISSCLARSQSSRLPSR